MTATTHVGDDADFTSSLTINGNPAALRAAICTDAGVSGWWAPTVSPGPELLTISFGDVGAEVHVVAQPELVIWEVLDCSAEPDWVGTTIEFATTEATPGSIELVFAHRGLGGLPCAEQCVAGWTHFLPSLVSFVESGIGTPATPQS
jgi:hypothetical protein